MARLSLFSLVFFLLLISFMPSFEARKLLNMSKRNVASLEDGLVLSVLPKGPNTTTSSPSDKGHAAFIDDDEKNFALHLAKIDRILESVPSPGHGH